MVSLDLIDTTEMYLKTIFEMEEDGVVPLRARIVERLDHSGPTVSQTVARMERDGLVTVRDDRRLELTPKGQQIAFEVMRKHRLAERLLVDIIGLPWTEVHEEACRWEHVMSAAVEERLEGLLNQPRFDPYGNPLPGIASTTPGEVSIASRAEDGEGTGVLTRIGEPVQAEPWLLAQMQELGLVPAASLGFKTEGSDLLVWNLLDPESGALRLESRFSPHLFVCES